MSTLRAIESICREATFHYMLHESDLDLLPFAVKVLEAVTDGSATRKEVVESLDSMLAFCPRQLCQLCVHYLGWPEFKDHYMARREAALKSWNWREQLVTEDMLSALSSTWETPAIFYAGILGKLNNEDKPSPAGGALYLPNQCT